MHDLHASTLEEFTQLFSALEGGPEWPRLEAELSTRMMHWAELRQTVTATATDLIKRAHAFSRKHSAGRSGKAALDNPRQILTDVQGHRQRNTDAAAKLAERAHALQLEVDELARRLSQAEVPDHASGSSPGLSSLGESGTQGRDCAEDNLLSLLESCGDAALCNSIVQQRQVNYISLNINMLAHMMMAAVVPHRLGAPCYTYTKKLSHVAGYR